jgi:Na+-translocating ferredoxin:NAD+ oxidoreductase RnfD subunit
LKYIYQTRKISGYVKGIGFALALYNLIQPTISLEMPVPSQGHYGFHSFPVVD